MNDKSNFSSDNSGIFDDNKKNNFQLNNSNDQFSINYLIKNRKKAKKEIYNQNTINSNF